MKKKFIIMAFLTMSSLCVFAQFTDNGTSLSTSFETSPVYREGSVGIGFNSLGTFNTTRGISGLSVYQRQIAQVEAGSFGPFASGNTWCALGLGNPSGFGPNPYGLAIAKGGNVGFFNLFPGANGEDLVAGFGSTGINANRYKIVSYNNASTFAPGKDLLVANPGGATGINAEPLSTFWVDARLDNATPFRNIAIVDLQRFGIPDASATLNASSGIGAQANASLQNSGILAEGFRAQYPAFGVAPLPAPAPFNTLGVATNVQVVKSPFGGPNANAIIDVVSASNVNGTREYAEITWQDLDIADPLSATDCSATIPVIEGYDKMFISFRNNQNVNPFGVGNKLPIMTFQGNGRVGIGTLQPTSGSGCTGAVYNRPILLDVNGAISSSGTVLSSDKRFKQNIKPVEDALSLIRRLQGTNYEFRTEEFKERNFPQGNQYGFIAQDVEKVIPEMAFENSDGYYVMNYTMLIPLLTEAIKQQDKTITEQATTITELRTEIAELRSAFNDFKAGQAANGVEGYRLEQNAPNPFSQNTVIGYAVPAGTTGARVNVYDLAGRLVKSFNIADQSGQITMNAGDMSNGLYIYDLQVNGRQILERKMTVVKD